MVIRVRASESVTSRQIFHVLYFYIYNITLRKVYSKRSRVKTDEGLSKEIKVYDRELHRNEKNRDIKIR